ncbi:MAG TPA: hypothetical protein PKI62_14395 [bacterium]|nr:hypothetical protein [bacterium]HPR89408.1 hypothetical protein [bacterium]
MKLLKHSSGLALLVVMVLVLIFSFSQRPVTAGATKEWKYHETIPLTNPGMFVPCALDGEGEFVAWYGDMNYLFYMTLDPAGTYHSTIHQNPQGAYGIGETSHQLYRVAGAETLHENYTGEIGGWPVGQYNYTAVGNFHVIGPGTGNNLVLRIRFRVVINANEEMKVYVESQELTCK